MHSSARSYALADLPWTAVAAHLATDRRLIVPVGACAQHGPHLPVSAGTVLVDALADDLSREFGVLRAPTQHYGAAAPFERDTAGSAGLRPKTLHRLLNELLSSWAAQGFDEFIAVTAGLNASQVEAIATVRALGARVRVVEALSLDLTPFMDDGSAGPEHAGEALTSLLLHLRPGVVRMDEARDFTLDPAIAKRLAQGRLRRLPEGCPGVVGRPTRASAEKGGRMYEHILQKIRHKVFIAPVPVETGE